MADSDVFFFFDKQAQFIKEAKKTPTYTGRIPSNKGQKQTKNQKTNHPSTGGNPLQEI